MSTWTEKLETIWEEAQLSIITKVRAIGGNSKEFDGLKVIAVSDDVAFNLDNGNYLTEVGEELIIDNKGYQYAYGVLNYEQLTELADWVETLN